MSRELVIIGGGAVLVGCATVGLTILGVQVALESSRQWSKFKTDHHCRIVQKVDGTSTVATSVGTNGQVTVTPVFIPGKIAWLCDDGITYWK